MKILFVGPSLPDAEEVAGPDFVVCPPACRGDVLRATREGATVIGLVDGSFEQVAPVWHKELLFALSVGVEVYGAASMGALRALECQPFGMIGIGRIFEWYRTGVLDDDADVAQIHGPAELLYPSLSLPLANLLATLCALVEAGRISVPEARALEAAGRQTFFKERTLQSVATMASLPGEGRRKAIEELLLDGAVDQKRADALALMETLRSRDAIRRPPEGRWRLNVTSQWKRMSGSE